MLSKAAGQALAMAVAFAVVAGRAEATDKAAESDLRWGLNYCGKVLLEIDRAKGQEMSAGQISRALEKWEPNYKKFLEYVDLAKARDPTVTSSATVYDKKDNSTFAAAYQQCQKLPAVMAEYRLKLQALKQAHEAGEQQERQAGAAAELKRQALEYASSAIWGMCAGFQGFAASAGIDENIKIYNDKKKLALETLPAIVSEDFTAPLKAGYDVPAADTTRKVGEWFTYCDAMMPAHAEKVRKAEKELAEKSAADAARRKAENDRLRAEQAAQFTALVQATKGDRQQVLKGKGFLPWWPRSGNLQSAPVWKWSVSITHEPERCETFQFAGNKLVKSLTELGSCP